MSEEVTMTLIVPTRQRTAQLGGLLDSVAATTAHAESLEIILVVDADDPASMSFRHEALPIKHVVVQPGQTMGVLNSEGYEASTGEYIMLLNDDVLVRTRGWDERVRACFDDFPDGIVLVHVNDTLIREHLCTFPIVSRTFCELAGGICPRSYIRYRIDDHIEDVFNLLGVLGVQRTVYLRDVVFEHLNSVAHPEADRVYMSDPNILAVDAPMFDALFDERKELALRLIDYIDQRARLVASASRRQRLACIIDPFSLRVPGRQRVKCSAWAWWITILQRGRACIRQRGYRGLVQAAGRRVARLLPSPVRSSPTLSSSGNVHLAKQARPLQVVRAKGASPLLRGCRRGDRA